MFRGQFVHSIDQKGRVSVPARFREVLARLEDTRFILTPAPFDTCLHLHPLSAWEELEARVAELPRLDPNIVRFRRIYLSAAVECDLDKQGRVLVPPQLREHGALAGELLWAGMGRSVELWSKTNWDAAMTLSADEAETFRQAVERIQI